MRTPNKRKIFFNGSIAVLSIAVGIFCFTSIDADPTAISRKEMVDIIKRDAFLLGSDEDFRFLSKRVMEAMSKVPRHLFVPRVLRPLAYENRPLPIGYGQTISQPYIVALMTHLLNPDRNDTVLEIGTGSGYQAAILSELVKEVYTIEIIQPLGLAAKKRLSDLNYNNVTVRISDGYYGLPDRAPFDGILVTAAASHIPPPLIRQLKKGGRMVIPVGSQFHTQVLILVEKQKNGKIKTRYITPVMFVPLTGEH